VGDDGDVSYLFGIDHYWVLPVESKRK